MVRIVYKDGKPYAYNSRGRLVMVEEFDPETMESFTLTRDMTISPEQIEMLERASEMPQVYDEDCPPSTPEMLRKMRRFWAKPVAEQA